MKKTLTKVEILAQIKKYDLADYFMAVGWTLPQLKKYYNTYLVK